MKKGVATKRHSRVRTATKGEKTAMQTSVRARAKKFERATRPSGERIERGLPSAVAMFIDNIGRERRQGRFAPVVYSWFVGIFIHDYGSWRLVVEKSTRPGIQQIADLVEKCELWNVKFAVFINEPQGMRALEVVLDVPTGSTDRARQRPCIELSRGHLVDFMDWLDSYLPRAETQ